MNFGKYKTQSQYFILLIATVFCFLPQQTIDCLLSSLITITFYLQFPNLSHTTDVKLLQLRKRCIPGMNDHYSI